MSLYIQWTNCIKERADESWLTERQQEVYKRLLNHWHNHAFVNLYGASGSGKTFIARILVKTHNYVYTQDLQEVPHNAPNVALDNVKYTRMLRPLARSMGLGRVLLITQKPIMEAMPSVQLELTEKDIRQFQAIVAQPCDIIFTRTVPTGMDLANIIRDEVIKRGESNVY
jgi:energy-coupling factor transporter ATP-binding protein EcfA2